LVGRQPAEEAQPEHAPDPLTPERLRAKVARAAEARLRAGEVLDDPDRYEPVAVAFATDVLLASVPGLPRAEASRLLRRIIPLLESTPTRIEGGDEGGVDLSTFSKTCRLLGSCHELLQEDQAALSCSSRGIAAHGGHPAGLERE
jgi:hypothetical protein